MNSFYTATVEYKRGQQLTAESLNILHEYLRYMGGALIESMCDGIITGLDISVVSSDGLAVEPGVFKCGGHIGVLDKELPLNPIDWKGKKKLVLHAGRTEKMSQNENIFQTQPCKIVTGNKQWFDVTWHNINSRNEGIVLCRLDKSAISLKNNQIKTDAENQPENLDEILQINVGAGIPQMVYAEHSGRGLLPTVHPEIQRRLAWWLRKKVNGPHHYLLPSLCRGDLPVCDYTGCGTIKDAVDMLYKEMLAIDVRHEPQSVKKKQQPIPTNIL